MSPRTPLQRQEADRRGREGEAEAAMFLTQQGWRILAERVKTKAGEIDLIAKRTGLVAFVEVNGGPVPPALAMRSTNAGLPAWLRRSRSCGRLTRPKAKTFGST